MIGRHITTTIVMTALAVVLVVMGVWGWREVTKPLPPLDSSQTQGCTKAETTRQVYVRRNQVTVSVFNAGTRHGFAALTLQRLEDLGFNPGAAANAPADSGVRRAKVFTTVHDDTAARLVARNVGKHVPVTVTDNPMGPGIDVVIGQKMHHLARHAPAKLKLPKPITTCIKVD